MCDDVQNLVAFFANSNGEAFSAEASGESPASVDTHNLPKVSPPFLGGMHPGKLAKRRTGNPVRKAKLKVSGTTLKNTPGPNS